MNHNIRCCISLIYFVLGLISPLVLIWVATCNRQLIGDPVVTMFTIIFIFSLTDFIIFKWYTREKILNRETLEACAEAIVYKSSTYLIDDDITDKVNIKHKKETLLKLIEARENR